MTPRRPGPARPGPARVKAGSPGRAGPRRPEPIGRRAANGGAPLACPPRPLAESDCGKESLGSFTRAARVRPRYKTRARRARRTRRPAPPPRHARRPRGEELRVARGRRPRQRQRHAGQAQDGGGAAQVVQAHHGEAAPGAHQREPGPAQGAHPGRAEERQLAPLQAGEGRHPGDDREAPAEPAAGADDGRAAHGPRRAGQVPRRLRRVHERGDPLPLHLRGGEQRGAHAAAGPPGQLHDPDPRRDLPPPAAAAAAAAARRRLRPAPRRRGAPGRHARQAGRRRGGARQALRRLPAGAGARRPLRLPHPQHGLRARRRPRPPLRRRPRSAAAAAALHGAPRPGGLGVETLVSLGARTDAGTETAAGGARGGPPVPLGLCLGRAPRLARSCVLFFFSHVTPKICFSFLMLLDK